MSGLGSMQIGNLRTPMDYKKAVQTQDELLRIAIANDLNISEARRLYQAGEPLVPLPQDLKTPAEIQADDALQEQTGLQNLLKLFSYREASAILASLTRDQIFVMNMSFPDIEADIKKRFNTKLLNPQFFKDYLIRYTEELNASKGVSSNLAFIRGKFDDLTANIDDVKANLPTPTQMRAIANILSSKYRNVSVSQKKPLFDKVVRIGKSLPTDDMYNSIENDGPITRLKTLEEIQNNTESYPTKDQVDNVLWNIDNENISEMDGLSQLSSLFSGITEPELVSMESLPTKIKSVSRQPPRQMYKELYSIDVGGVKNVDSLSVGLEIPNGKRENIYINLADGSYRKVDKDVVRQLSGDAQFMDFYFRQTGIRKLENLKALKNMILSNAKARPTEAEPIPIETTGSGLYHISKNGRFVCNQFGSGIDPEVEPIYKTFGKYVVHIPQLKHRDILNVKFRSLGRIPQFKATPISEVFRDFMLDLLSSGKANQRVYDTVPVEERKLFEKIASSAGIINGLGLKTKTLTEEDKKENDRFELLRGEYLAGNNSPVVLKELRKLVVKFMNSGKITKATGTDLLMEFSMD